MTPLPRHVQLENRHRLDAKTLHTWLRMLQVRDMSQVALTIWERSLLALEAGDWSTLHTMAGEMFKFAIRKDDETGEAAARVLRAIAAYARCKPLREVAADLDFAFRLEIEWSGVYNRALALAVAGMIYGDAVDTARAVTCYTNAAQLLESILRPIWKHLGQDGAIATDHFILALVNRAKALIPQPYVSS